MVDSLFCNGRHPSVLRWVSLLFLALLVGCGRDEIKVYRVGKDPAAQPQAQPAAAMPPGHPDPAGTASAGVPRLKYTLPSGWQEAPPGQMRVASFRVMGDGKQADVSVVPLPGMMGGDLENVNRWRSTVGLPAVKEEDLPKLAQPVEVAGQQAQLFEQAGENPGSGEKTRILTAVSRRDGVAWFFKMAGDDDLVARQKPAFLDFLKTLTFEAAPSAPPGGAAETALPASHQPIGEANLTQAANPPSTEGKPTWQVPSGWQEINGGQFLVAKFVIGGADNAQANVNVSMSAGAGGGVVGNVNRWRGQLGLGELPEAEINKLLTPLNSPSGTVMVDMSGKDARTGQPARLLAAIVPQASQTWFYKLMGNEQVVQREKDAFSKFVQSAKYP
jgi:hypothetical protein